MNCHKVVLPDSPQIQMLAASYKSGEPIEWERVHRLPDYVSFDHSIHVNSGVGCVSCHGRVDQMDVVRHAKPLSMSWCLGCHRNPEENLRPLDKITDMAWEAENISDLGTELMNTYQLNPTTDCSGCHR